MKKFSGILLAFSCVINGQGAELTQPTMALYSTTNATQREVAWSTEPGIRYVLQESTNLASNDWATVAGYPSKADALAQQHLIGLDSTNQFFRKSVSPIIASFFWTRRGMGDRNGSWEDVHELNMKGRCIM